MTNQASTAKVVGSTPKTIWQELESWAKTLKPWQCFILGHAVHSGPLNEEKITEAYNLFLRDNKLIEIIEPTAEIPAITGRPESATTAQLHLTKLCSLRAINALPDDAELSFSPQLTIIYGNNGTGKSGFVRVLSNACFSRDEKPILPNVYKLRADEAFSQSAELMLKSGDLELPKIVFDGKNHNADLKRFSVFNTSVALSLLTQQNPLCFKPAGFDVFPEMARVYAKLAERLTSDIARRTKVNGFGDSFIGDSEIAHYVRGLNASTNIDKLRELATFTDIEKNRLEAIAQQIAELQSKSSVELVKQLNEAKADILAFVKQLNFVIAPLTESAREAYRNQLQTYATKAQAAKAHGTESFKQSFFRGTGSPEWKRFIEAAYALARTEGPNYPQESDHCLLCQRPLDTAAKDFIEKMWAFLVGNTQREENEAKAVLLGSIKDLQPNRMQIFSDESRVHTHLTRINPTLAADIEQLLKQAELEREAIVSAIHDSLNSFGGNNASIASDQLPNLFEQLQTQVGKLDEQIAELQKSDVQSAIKTMEAERVTLRHKQVLSQILNQVEAFLVDMAWIERASGTPKRNLSPRPITDKETEFFGSLIADGYKTRLEDECRALDCNLPIEFQTQGHRGETVRSLEIKGCSPEEILSEGEQRAIALADFLTEVALNPAGAGIIIDDPVNSQDHQRKGKIAKRLVDEADSRQVIVFTHDMPFLTMLIKEAEDNGIEHQMHWVQRDGSNNPGQVSLNDCPAPCAQYRKTTLAKNSFEEAKKVAGSQRDALIRKSMEELRRTIEEIVPEFLFRRVVNRWTDRVMVTALERVEWDKATIQEIVTLFEELSVFIVGHSHTDEGPAAAPPDLAQLEAYIIRVDAVIAKIKPR